MNKILESVGVQHFGLPELHWVKGNCFGGHKIIYTVINFYSNNVSFSRECNILKRREYKHKIGGAIFDPVS